MLDTTAKYDRDFYAWTQEQASFLQSGKFDCLDLENLAEEIASLGRQERRELVNRLGILIGHILKWEYQPDMRSKSWRCTIKEQQLSIQELITDNPSLQSYMDQALSGAYAKALVLVEKETNLQSSSFPQECPLLLSAILGFNPHE
jgi:hypothetical protein